MTYLSLSRTGHWLLLLFLVVALTAPQAMGQSRERGRSGTAKKERVERKSDRKEKASRSRSQRTERPKPEARSARRYEEITSTGRSSEARRSRSSRSSDQARTGRSSRSSDQARTGRSSRRSDQARTGRSSRSSDQTRTGRSQDRSRRVERGSTRSRRTPRYYRPETWHQRYRNDRRYQRRHWARTNYYRRHRLYRPFVVRPFIQVDLNWPWVHRHHHGWRPHYRYRQVIHLEAGWGGRRHASRIDVRTYYTHELRYASRDRAEVDVYVDRIEFYENGRFLGEVRNVPDQLARIRATVYRNGTVEFDRDVSVVGDARVGFELVSTRHYDGFLYDQYRPAHGLRVGQVDLRSGRVVSTSYSRLFDPYNFNGYVPVSLLPEDSGWLLDYGQASFSGSYYDDDPYYYGGYSGYDGYDDAGDDYYEEDYYEDAAGRPYFSVRSTIADGNFDVAAQTQLYDRKHRTSFGAEIRLRRETEFVRVQ